MDQGWTIKIAMRAAIGLKNEKPSKMQIKFFQKNKDSASRMKLPSRLLPTPYLDHGISFTKREAGKGV